MRVMRVHSEPTAALFEKEYASYQNNGWKIAAQESDSVFLSHSISRVRQIVSVIAYALFCCVTICLNNMAKTELKNAWNKKVVIQLKCKEKGANISNLFNKVMGPSGPASDKGSETTQEKPKTTLKSEPQVQDKADTPLTTNSSKIKEKSLEPEKLTNEQIVALIQKKDQKDFDQLYPSMSSFEYPQWKLFTLPDLQRIDFTKLFKACDQQTEKIFGHIFSSQSRSSSLSDEDRKALLQGLNGDDLTLLLPFFNWHHFKFIGKQIGTIDFAKAGIKDWQAFDTIFGQGSTLYHKTEEAHEIQNLKNLTGKNLTDLLHRFPMEFPLDGYPKFFHRNHIDRLTKEQIAAINFTTLNINQETFECFFGSGYARSSEGSDQPKGINERLPKINITNLLPLLKFFNQFNWQLLSPEQLEAIGKEKLQDPQIQKGYQEETARRKNFIPGQKANSLFTDAEIQEILKKPKLDELYPFIAFFNKAQWKLFQLKDMKKIDFTKIMKENDRGSQNIWHHIAGREQSEKDKKAFFQSLNSDNVQALAPFFDKYAFDELSVEQIAHVDFTKCNMNGWMFSEIFSTGPSSSKQFAPDNFDKRILHIKGPSLMHLLQFFNEFNWGQLNNEQWASIQADQLNQATREGYDKEKLRRKA